jgi:hypothetical protein
MLIIATFYLVNLAVFIELAKHAPELPWHD